MKSALILLSLLFVIGVFGDDAVKSVSVMEGDSVTLNTDLTEIQRNYVVEWKLNGSRMFRITYDARGISILDDTDGAFGDRLQLDNQTGNLKITNTRNTDSGEYILKIRSSSGSSELKFSLSVVISEVKSVSVMEGDSVTLNTGVNGLQRDDKIQWRHQNILVAGIDNNYVQRYRDRLELDNQTGSLTITNIRTEYAGEYEVDVTISSRRYTIHKSFSVNVNETVNSVLVMEGDSVTLHTDAPIPRNDAVLWFINDVHITPLTGRWSNTAQNNQTEDLTIRNIRRDQSGDYKVIFTNIHMLFTRIHRKFHINITDVFSDETDGVKTVSVMKGDPVSLNTSVTEIQKGDLIEWLFGPQNITIAKTDGKNNSISYNDTDVRFKNRLNLDIQTGDLTIENSNSEHSGRYQLKIINNNTYTIQKSFSVTVNSGLSPGAIGVIVIAVLAAATAVAGVIYYRHKSSKPQRSREVNGQNHTSNKDEETELAKPAEAVE